MSEYAIHCGDCVAWAENYTGPLFHALLCDAPYHLTTITDRFGNEDSAPAKGRVYASMSKGFMGKQWDGGDLAFRPETWAAFMRVLHPGAFIMAFASSRGWHRMACAIEDAGFVIHPSIFLWAQGQGFPKATRIKGKEEWSGHRYGGQALKPAVEVIIVAQKPYAGRPLDCITETGAGALNIDAGRIGADSIPSNRWTDNAHPFGGGAGNEYETVNNKGRWPANLILSHLPGCNSECVDGCAVKAMGEQSGESISSGGLTPKVGAGDGRIYSMSGKLGENAGGLGDSGTASRFFYNADYTLNKLEQADPVFYCAKAVSSERDAGLEGMLEVKSGMSNGAQLHGEGYDKGQDIGLNRVISRRNIHPTVKPINLAQHLASLLLPPALCAPRRLFVPFSGAGSEMIGAILAGWEFVQGVEIESEYVDIAEARLKFWSGYKPKPQEKIKPPVQVEIPNGQTSFL